MISMVIIIWVPSAGISSVADDSEGKAQGHDRRRNQEDNQAQLASGVAPSLAHQPTQNNANADEPHVPHPGASWRRGPS